MSAKKAVILLSGGVDSSTSMAVAKSEGFELYALSFDYGQRHAVELESARRVAEALGAKKHLAIKFDMTDIGGSALTSEIEVPKGGITPSSTGGIAPAIIPVTYVPARNTIFLSFALSWAEVLRAENIFIGANVTDYSGYPDCRPEYLRAFEDMANLATKASVEGEMRFRINAPLINMTKGDIIRKGASLGLDYSLTWSCYDPQPVKGSAAPGGTGDYVPCRKCDSCRFRAKGFREAGLKDPLI